MSVFLLWRCRWQVVSIFWLWGFLTSTPVVRAEPAWWSARGVLSPVGIQNDDNHAAVNVGQIKHVAAMAMEEMEAQFPGGAGQSIRDMVGWGMPPEPETSWRANKTVDNQYAAANAGQLKFVAKRFLDRLVEVGVRRLDTGYPWTVSSPDENFALVKAGQLKNVFSFDIPDLKPDIDSDGDGIDDAWELSHGMNPLGSADALFDLDFDGLTALQEYNLGLFPSQWGLPLTAGNDYDGDGSLDWKDARPVDSAIGDLVISIEFPTENLTLP